MAYQEIDTDVGLNKLIYDDSHVTLYITFDHDGTPVDVDSPQFDLRNAQSQSVLSKGS